MNNDTSDDTSNNIIEPSQNNLPSAMEVMDIVTQFISDSISPPITPTTEYLHPRLNYSRHNFSRGHNTNSATPFNFLYEEYTQQLSPPEITNDISDNSYSRFLTDLLNLPPIPSRTNNLETLINRTLNQKAVYKDVLSKEGEDKIKKVKFNPETHKETVCCPITQTNFSENDEISELPCGHIFSTDAILTWLKTEKAACPCCRYKLPSVEKKEEPQQPINRRENVRFTHPFGPRISNFRRFFMSQEERLENQEMQRVLLASLEEQYMPSNADNAEDNAEDNAADNAAELTDDTYLYDIEDDSD
jgi:hypothetical protein